MVEHGAGGNGRWPDFIGLGATRSGTTWLHACLDEHPEVFVPGAKELTFFWNNWDRGPAWYRAQFDGAADRQVCGEITPHYLVHPEAIDRIAELRPDARLFAVLRNPIDRAYSLYWLHRSDYEGMEFEEVLERYPDRLESGRYAEQLEYVFDRFAPEQVLVLLYDDLVADNRVFLERVHTFLGVDPTFEPTLLDRSYNAVVFPRLQDTLERMRMGWVKRAVKSVGLAPVIRKFQRKRGGSGYPPMAEETREKLRTYFEEPNARLAQLLDREIDWD